MKRLINFMISFEIKNIIVEGIENLDDLEYIRKLPVVQGQGYIWDKSVKCDELFVLALLFE